MFAGILFFMCKLNLTGQKFGRWTILEEVPERYQRRVQYKCRCDCGTERIMIGGKIKKGLSYSCGCWAVERTKIRNKTHGLSKVPLYSVWNNIRKRCYVKKTRQYKDYGGRGIKMYAKWINDPASFIRWCENNGWQKGLQVDRRNNDGHYYPRNIRFITHKEQQRNTRKNVFYTHEGQTKCIAEWAESLGVNYITVCVRIRRGWTINEALFGKKDKKTWENLNT